MSNVPDSADIVIAGGGPVGAALAHALSSLRGLSVVQIAPEVPASAPASGRDDDRPITLSWGSRLLLQRLGLWDTLRATPIARIHVSQQRQFGHTEIRAADHKVDALGYVVSYADLCRLPPAPGIVRVAGTLTQWKREDGRMACELAVPGNPAQRISARLLVLADGGRTLSPELGFHKDYGQSAVVCSVLADRPQSGTAWERFTPEGPIALLPVQHGQEHGMRLGLVWSSRTATAQSLMTLDDEAFLHRLQQGFGRRLGKFTSAGPRSIFPLSLRYRRQVSEPGLIAIGNAAQTLHPVAAQGLNLGLRDAWELAELLHAGEFAPDSTDLARRYAQRRAADRRVMSRLTDGMISAFTLQWPLASTARGTALAVLDMLPLARRLLSRRMMFGARGLP